MRPDYEPDFEHCILPYVQWYQGDFVGGVRGMKAQEIGIYTMLLMEMYMRGRALDQSHDRLARVCGTDKRTFEKVLTQLIDDGKIIKLKCGYWNERCENAFRTRAKVQQQNSDSAHKSWENRRKNKGSDEQSPSEGNAGAMLNSEAQNIISEPKGSSSETSSDGSARSGKSKPYSEAYEAFWSEYPRSPNMSKSRAYAGWQKLTLDEREACRAAVKPYKAFLASKPDHPVMHATTFINERRFEGFATVAVNAPAAISEEDWRRRLRYGRQQSAWITKWGPAPGRPGCMVPADLLEPDDGADWREREIAA